MFGEGRRVKVKGSWLALIHLGAVAPVHARCGKPQLMCVPDSFWQSNNLSPNEWRPLFPTCRIP